MTVPSTEPRYSAHDLARALGTFPPTEEQRAVIEAPLRPLVVVAGAGSGKTETMAARVIWLVANGLVAPQDVLGLTFTRKAALELSARLGTKLRQLWEAGLWALDDAAGEQRGEPGTGDAFDLPTISTYHAYAGRLVAEHGLRLGIEPDSVLLSEAAGWQLAHDVVHSYDGDMTLMGSAPSTVVRAVLALSGELGEHLVEPQEAMTFLDELAERLENLPQSGRALKTAGSLAAVLRQQSLVYPLIQAYRDAKSARGALDFGDQMALAARLARDVPQVGAAERARFGAVLLDEFQDTSEAQMVLLTSLFAGHDVPVTAVGDPHQSIYGWRGASATTLTRFPHEFTDGGAPARVLQLSTSWRNDVSVLDAANAVARPLRDVGEVPVAPLAPSPAAGPGRVEVARWLDQITEAEQVADWIRDRWTSTEVGTAAVLCRTRAQFAPVVDALRRRGLPVEVVGLGGLLDTPEILDLTALLWMAQEPTRGDQVMRLLAGPVCRLGAADIDALWAWARLQGGRSGQVEREHAGVLAEAVEHPPAHDWVGPDGEHLSPEGHRRVTGLARVLRTVRSLAGTALPDLVVEAERLLGLDIEVASDPDLHPTWGRAPLDAFAEVAAGFSATAERVTLGAFLAWLDAAREHERGLEDAEVPELAETDVDAGAVQVLTVHAAKGLEWDAVAVPGLVEGTFPSARVTPRHEERHWWVKPIEQKGWLTGIENLPTPLRGDRQGRPDLDWDTVTDVRDLRDRLEGSAAGDDGPGVVGLYERQGEFSVQEERRLAYVALTRARHRLLLSAPVWSTGRKPRVTSRFLEEVRAAGGVEELVWVPMPDGDAPEEMVHPRLDDQGRAPWPVGRDDRRRAVLETASALVAARTGRPDPGVPAPSGAQDGWVAMLQLLLAERDERRSLPAATPLPEHLSTSSLVQLAADPEEYRRRLRRPLPTPPATHARLGTAFHAWVEEHLAMETLVDLHELESADELGVPDDLADLQRSFLDSEWAARVPKAVEVPLETRVGGQQIRGRIDAVFADDDGGVTIVDWKTGSPGSPEQQRVRLLQLAVYRVAYARLAGLPLDQVRAAFFYARTGTTVRPELPDETTLEAEVAGLTTHDTPARPERRD